MMPFIPDTLPLASLDWTKFIRLIGQANAELARYDAMLQAIVNPQVLLSPLTLTASRRRLRLSQGELREWTTLHVRRRYGEIIDARSRLRLAVKR